MSLPRLSVNNHILVNMLMWILIIGGGVISFTMVREMFPEFRPDKLLVTTVHPGVQPAELEKSVTVKVENAIRNVDGIERIESVVGESVSTTIVTILNSVDDPDVVLRDVKAEVDAIEDLPVDAEKTTVTKLVPRLPVISVALYGEGSEAARKEAARKMRDDLLALPGISQVSLGGVRQDEIHVDIRPEKLLEYNITFDEVARVIRESNIDLSGGQLEGSRSTVAVRTVGEEQEGEKLKNLIVRAQPDGKNIFLHQVADIRDSFTEQDLQGYYNGEPTTTCVVFKTPDQDAIQISQLVKGYVAGKEGLPFDAYGYEKAQAEVWYWRPVAVGITWVSSSLNYLLGRPDPQYYYEQSKLTPFDHNFKIGIHTDLARFVEGRIKLMTDNGWQGLGLVLLTLVLFMNWRVAFWAATGLPVTFFGTFIVMLWLGQSLNLISLMGLIIVLGIDVDEAIVMGENIYRHIEEGLSPREAAIKGSEEVLWPVIVMSGTTIGAFVPLMFLEGQIGTFFSVLPMVVVSAMSVSTIEALVILPAHLSTVRVPPKQTAGENKGLFFLRWINSFQRFFQKVIVEVVYDWFIRTAMKNRYTTIAIGTATIMVVFGMFQGGFVNTQWVQKMDSETLVAELEMPMGSPVEATRDRLLTLSEYGKQIPEIVNVQMLVGVHMNIAGEGAMGAKPGSHLGQLIIELQESSERNRSSEEILAQFREMSADLSGINDLEWKSLNGGPGGRSIEIRLTAEDFSLAKKASLEVQDYLASFDGVSDITDDLEDSQREIQLRLLESARPAGMTTALLGSEVRNALFGREARRLSRDREDVRIMVRYPEAYREDVYRVEDMWIPSPNANNGVRSWVPMSEVAQLTEGKGFSAIHRSNQMRCVTVFADVDQTKQDETNVVTTTEKWFKSERSEEFPGVKFEVFGKGLETAKATKGLILAFPAALAIIYFMLAGLFHSYTQPFIVMCVVPFGVQGAFLGHWLTGYDFTIMSAIGIIALNGIVVNDSLVLVDFINGQVKRGRSLFDACVEGSKLRLRAIVLTTITTSAGMAPMMFETSFQAKFLIPLIISLVFGLCFATVITLVIVPAFYLVFADLRLIRPQAHHD